MDYGQIYRDHADDYDALVAAEDARGELAARLRQLVPAGSTLVDVGTGTGRIARMCQHAGRILGVERAPAMLAIAAAHRDRSGHADWQLFEADARALPLGDRIADAVVAGWVFGHFQAWMPDGWRDEVDRALAEMRRVARPGAPIVVIETLGTNHTTPRAHPGLDAYFAHLEAQGFAREVLRTDYHFADDASARRLVGRFFGDAMAAAIPGADVPECTGLWLARTPLA